MAIKASTYRDWKYLKGLNVRNPKQVDILDFSDFVAVHGIAALDAIFPKIKGRGQLDPPPTYLETGAKVRAWREF